MTDYKYLVDTYNEVRGDSYLEQIPKKVFGTDAMNEIKEKNQQDYKLLVEKLEFLSVKNKLSKEDYSMLYDILVDKSDDFNKSHKGMVSESIRENLRKFLKGDIKTDILNILYDSSNGIDKFDDLFRLFLKKTSFFSKNFKSLTIYDTVVYLAYFNNVKPNKVYLHTGTLDGVRTLIPKFTAPEEDYTITKEQIKQNNQDLYTAIVDLEYYKLEDFFCLAKDGEVNMHDRCLQAAKGAC
ncbi:hypothetical protein [Latilactobacillus sakei]|mgnify:CR=1 FL=1|uniref:hypothetical protein n=1 Tax=Latilactobacillus sakei TaxID=1599 RepID=UPI003F53099F